MCIYAIVLPNILPALYTHPHVLPISACIYEPLFLIPQLLPYIHSPLHPWPLDRETPWLLPTVVCCSQVFPIKYKVIFSLHYSSITWENANSLRYPIITWLFHGCYKYTAIIQVLGCGFVGPCNIFYALLVWILHKEVNERTEGGSPYRSDGIRRTR